MLSFSRSLKNFLVSVLNAFFFFFQFIYSFCFAGADIVQWLMKNLSIEDQGKVNHGWELTDISAVLYVCHKRVCTTSLQTVKQ